MSQNDSRSVVELMREFFAGLGFTQVRTDPIEADQLLELLVTALQSVTPMDSEQSETVRMLSERLALLKQGSVTQSLPRVSQPRKVHVDPANEARLMASIAASRVCVMREIDEENRRFGT